MEHFILFCKFIKYKIWMFWCEFPEVQKMKTKQNWIYFLAVLWNRNRRNRNFLTSGTGTVTRTVTC